MAAFARQGELRRCDRDGPQSPNCLLPGPSQNTLANPVVATVAGTSICLPGSQARREPTGREDTRGSVGSVLRQRMLAKWELKGVRGKPWKPPAMNKI